jgi:hypothetical protein
VIGVLLAAAYLVIWGLAMGTAASGLWPLAVIAGLAMGGICFRHEIRHMHHNLRG